MSRACRIFIVASLTAFVVCGCSCDKPTDSPQDTNLDDRVILRASSEHFKYYCVLRDAEVIDTLRVLLESNLARVSALYNFSRNDTVAVKIYPDFETFYDNISWPTDDVPSTLVGACTSAVEFKIISPLNSEPVNTYGEILLVAVHEFLHACHFHIYVNYTGDPVPPSWLFEGFASFEAQIHPSVDILRREINENDLPLIEQYEDFDFFLDNYGYHFCYTIFEFLLSEYGYEKLSKLLRYPTLIEYSLGTGVTMDTLNAGWHEFLIENYGG